jgi:dihydroorotate dehydrogenase (fumarate)
MDLSTTYMGLSLKNPIIVSSSKLTSKIENIKKIADAGAGAIVLKSLFEEQLLADPGKLLDQDEKYFWYPEAVDFINEHSKEQGIKEYLALIEDAKKETDVPIIASINCTTPNEWPKFAAKLEEAGADGLELNISIMPFDPGVTSQAIEDTYGEIVKEVKRFVKIPVAVKIGPMFTNLFALVKMLEGAGADAVVLFNRFYRPDIDIKNEKVVRDRIFSSPEEMTEPLRWVSLLSGKVNCDIAGNTGIHTTEGLIKFLLAGAAGAQICTTLYKNGIDTIETMLVELEAWLKEKNYSSVAKIQGKVSAVDGNVSAFERVQYMRKTLTEI